MTDDVIAAEVEPSAAERAPEAARALQSLGFRVLHVGLTISVQASRQQWEDTFRVAFTRREAPVMRELDSRASHQEAASDTVVIPEPLHGLVAGIAFIRPPELFGPTTGPLDG
ncbi:MAG: hypothetical protein ACR2MA_05350 [Egibacteraceae bacterium]